MSGVPILGVDAGGSATRAVLVRDGEILARFEEPPLNVLLQSDAHERLAALIIASGAAAAGLGLAGLRGSTEAVLMEQRLQDVTGVDVVVVDDTEATLVGAFGHGPGIVVIAGTGSNALGRNREGRSARAGGYGFLLGDEGSAYWFGSQAVRAALHSSDGTGPKTDALEAVVAAEYGLDFEGIVRLVYNDPADRQLLARLARTVMALDYDPVMTGILDAGTDCLVGLAQVLGTQLGSGQRAGELPIAMHGGVFENAYVRRRFVEATGAIAAARAPEFGAVDLALQHVQQRASRGTSRSS
ncbi:MAG TPA: BadF/BadG/BcrA/BcrD ATPase family protein [Acidothermaceae bacterium]